MTKIITIILLLSFFVFEQAFAQSTLTRKVFTVGSKTHFDNFKKCDFYFECDCCSGQLLFPTQSSFLLINDCVSDYVVTKGTYSIADNGLTLHSDGHRIEVKYNWEREMNPDAEPAYFVKDSAVSGYQLDFKFDSCQQKILLNQKGQEAFIGIETEKKLSDVIVRLKRHRLTELLELE